MKKALAVASILATGVATATEYGRPMRFPGGAPATTPTSLIALLGSPADWNGRAVSVDGFLRSDLHGVVFFSTPAHCDRWMGQYGVLISLDTLQTEIEWSDIPADRCVFATVEGRFAATPASPPEPDTITLWHQPGLIEAQYIAYD